MEPALDIKVLPHFEIREASLLLSRAFAEDPVITCLLNDPARRLIAFPAFFEGVLEELLPSGKVFAAYGPTGLIGIAAWLPPQVVEPDEASLASSHRCRVVVQNLFPQTFQALYDGFAAAGKLHPLEPHWYLAFVGIEPEYQGGGVGRELLKGVLDDADAKGILCYLETPFLATHRFYERLGFEIRTQETPFRGAPPIWTMLRRPRLSISK